MPAGHYNFTIEQGADFYRLLTWKDPSGNAYDLTGFSARMKIKTLSGKLILSLTNVLSVAGDGLTLGGTAGTVAITIGDATTAALTFSSAKYDLELVSPAGTVVRLIEGLVTLDKE